MKLRLLARTVWFWSALTVILNVTILSAAMAVQAASDVSVPPKEVEFQTFAPVVMVVVVPHWVPAALNISNLTKLFAPVAVVLPVILIVLLSKNDLKLLGIWYFIHMV